MADQKISALTVATTPLAGTEVLPIVQSGTTVKVSVDNLTTGKNVKAASVSVGTTSTVGKVTVNGDVQAQGAFGTLSGSLGVAIGAASGAISGNDMAVIAADAYNNYKDLIIAPRNNGADVGDAILKSGNFKINAAGKGVTSDGGAFLQAYGLVAAAGYVDLSINANGFAGILSVSATRGNYNPQSTRTVFAATCYGTTLTTTSLHTQDGSGGSNSFSVTCPSAGVVRITDTSGYGSSTAIYVTFHGAFNYLYA